MAEDVTIPLSDYRLMLQQRERMRSALETIDRGLTEEIEVRFGSMPERERSRSRVHGLLVVPRNIARAALNDGPPEEER